MILKALRLVFVLSIPSTLKQAHEHGCNKIKVIFLKKKRKQKCKFGQN